MTELDIDHILHNPHVGYKRICLIALINSYICAQDLENQYKIERLNTGEMARKIMNNLGITNFKIGDMVVTLSPYAFRVTRKWPYRKSNYEC